MLKLTRKALAAAYDYLRETEPFCKMGLPPSGAIRFEVVSRPEIFGEFDPVGARPTIRVSRKNIGHTVTLMATVAHEMLHLDQHQRDDRETHGRRYKRKAARVCAVHGFDLQMF